MGCCSSQPIDFNSEVNLFHFDLHRAVGKGAFGKVRVVEHKKTKKLYALKYIDKSRCIRQKAVANIIQERRLLEEIDHPFVVNLRYAFQDDDNCFFVLDLMLGGDLRFHLDRKGHLSEEVVRFWVAELASALVYLHKRRIVHRDLKPDNILLDSDGHAHITDFNVAIHYSERRLHTSVAGSMAYMAPEVIGRKGYTWCADWWSLGVTTYELLFNRRPFEGRTTDRMTNSILKDAPKFPDGPNLRCSSAAVRFVQGLLERTVSERLGCKPGGNTFEDIKNHPWMSSIDWAKLTSKQLQPPFVPDTRKANFDVSHELDEFLMVEKPLTHTKRKANLDLEKLKPELRQLEEQFTVYDFTSSQRRSYYPHNQPITTVVRSSGSEPMSVIQSQTHTLQPTATMAERSLAGSPGPDTTWHQPMHLPLASIS
ncbi:kinase-like domain-containing protein [Pisolithus orientalis]|uniref:kinase-like domain-containing protein n=1 Tax=Pisolithus orientalis TaxID=936130 RepID=UPI002225A57A|nr:kinase-like domain-containing protein [Pisolithus orientalis]KAI6025763.1 kinase-like domain-containing protein [Pisolithus orientalis]